MFDTAPADSPDPIRSASPANRWLATLELRLERRECRTVVARAHHHGPLRIQKPLYPDTPARADLLILHPPAGIAGGDHLRLDVVVDAGAQARITTPGASKWYRSAGPWAQQEICLRVADDAVLEWLPQEAIVYDGARVCTETSIHCTGSARACGWDLWMLGRQAAGERFTRGELRQRTRLYRGGRLLWGEHVRLEANDALRTSPLGWNGAHVVGTFWALGLPQDDSLLERCREIREDGVGLGVTRFEHGLWMARALGRSAERVRMAMTGVWSVLRPALCGAVGLPPRIWAT